MTTKTIAEFYRLSLTIDGQPTDWHLALGANHKTNGVTVCDLFIQANTTVWPSSITIENYDDTSPGILVRAGARLALHLAMCADPDHDINLLEIVLLNTIPHINNLDQKNEAIRKSDADPEPEPMSVRSS